MQDCLNPRKYTGPFIRYFKMNHRWGSHTEKFYIKTWTKIKKEIIKNSNLSSKTAGPPISWNSPFKMFCFPCWVLLSDLEPKRSPNTLYTHYGQRFVGCSHLEKCWFQFPRVCAASWPWNHWPVISGCNSLLHTIEYDRVALYSKFPPG